MKKGFAIFVLFGVVAGMSLFANGQGDGSADVYPNQPIKVICGYTSGGDTDINSRVMSKYVSEYIGQPMVVTNVTGAAGSIGAKEAASSDPDGYTVIFSHWGTIMNEMAGLVDFTIPEGFEVVGIPLVGETTLLVANADSPYDTVSDMMAAAKADPGSVKFAITPGSVVQLTTVTLEEANGVKFHQVDPGGKAETLGALKSGQFDVTLLQYNVVKDFLAAGEFKALGVIAETRNPSFPEIPTFREEGVQGMEAFEKKFFFYGFPKGTPQDVLDTFDAAVAQAAQDEGAIKEFGDMYFDLVDWDADKSIEFINGVRDSFEPYIGAVLKK